jgi:hypothetical protein
LFKIKSSDQGPGNVEATVPNTCGGCGWLRHPRVFLFPQPMKLNVCHDSSRCLFLEAQDFINDLRSQQNASLLN